MTASVRITVDRLGNIVKEINDLTRKDVLIGIPEAETNRQDEDGGSAPATNAALGYIHEHGSPANNIPARPFLIPGVKDAQGAIEKRLKQAADAALKGDKAAVDRQMHSAGIEAQNSVKTKINSGDFEPLAPATLAQRKARGRTGTKPLIDTGQLRNSITYVVRGK